MASNDTHDCGDFGDIPAYQKGNPHKLNSKVLPNEIIFEALPELNVSLSVPEKPTKVELQSLDDYVKRLKHLASLM